MWRQNIPNLKEDEWNRKNILKSKPTERNEMNSRIEKPSDNDNADQDIWKVDNLNTLEDTQFVKSAEVTAPQTNIDMQNKDKEYSTEYKVLNIYENEQTTIKENSDIKEVREILENNWYDVEEIHDQFSDE